MEYVKWDARGLKRGFVARLEKRISQAERGVNYEKPRYSRGDFTQDKFTNHSHLTFSIVLHQSIPIKFSVIYKLIYTSPHT